MCNQLFWSVVDTGAVCRLEEHSTQIFHSGLQLTLDLKQKLWQSLFLTLFFLFQSMYIQRDCWSDLFLLVRVVWYIAVAPTEFYLTIINLFYYVTELYRVRKKSGYTETITDLFNMTTICLNACLNAMLPIMSNLCQCSGSDL